MPASERVLLWRTLGLLSGLAETRWLAPVLALAWLTALTLAVFHHQIFEHWTFPWDFIGDYSSSPAFVATTIGSGHPLAWSPFVASGFPVDVDLQAGIYFPVWWVFGALHVPLTLPAVTDIQVAHVLAGSVGTLLLARARRLTWPWAAAAATAYLLFGGFYGQAEHADYVRGFAYLPWLLWCLTPSATGAPWRRLLALPPVGWLIATGAYPGQLISMSILGVVYVLASLLAVDPTERRRHCLALALAAIAAGATCVAVLLPYLLSEHDLVRTIVPTAAIRAAWALGPSDLLGSYLSTFAWNPDGTITSWAVALPILVGLGLFTATSLRRQLPVAASGAVALVLAMAPKIGLVGRAMVALGPVFTSSRFPAADYKAGIALAVILLSVDGWSLLPRQHLDHRTLGVVVMACLLFAGAQIASSTYAPPTRTMWLLAAVLVAAVVLSIARPRPTVLAVLLIALIAVDGFREVRDYRSGGTTSSWLAYPSEEAPYYARDVYIRALPVRLWKSPARRPARVAPSPIDYPDAAGWDADAYHVSDYGGTVERALWQAEQNPVMLSLLLKPWDAYVFPCSGGWCAAKSVRLPPPNRWRPSPSVWTLSYGPGRIVYEAHLAQPSLMVENESAIGGWHSSNTRARIVSTSLPFRTWSLAAGDYRFVAVYRQPGRSLQDLALIAALLSWGACGVITYRRHRNGRMRPQR